MIKPLSRQITITLSLRIISLSSWGSECNIRFYHYTSHCKWIPTSVFYGYNPHTINQQIIHLNDHKMEPHTTICLCPNNSKTNCSADSLGPVYPGQTLTVDLCVPCSGKHSDVILYAETHNALLPPTACKLANQNELVTVLNHTKLINFTIVSEAEERCEIFLTVSLHLYHIYEAFYVWLLPCPVGFVLLNGICNCDPVLLNNSYIVIESCDIDLSAISRPANSWIVHTPANYNNNRYLLCNDCPIMLTL